MSKRKKKKFRNQSPAPSGQVHNPEPAQVVSQAVKAAPVTVKPAERKVEQTTTAAYAAHSREYRQIGSDLVKLLVVNGLLLALTLVMYFMNRSNGFLENLYRSIF